MSEAQARIKINKLLEKAGWRFFNTDEGPANIILEGKASITKRELDYLGDDFEKTHTGYMDFLLLDEKGFPFVVLEAKKEERNPLDGKEQARQYARSQNVRFVILSNGNLHYFWDLESGNPEVITEFPRPESILHRRKFTPNPELLARENVTEDYIALTQNPDFKKDPRWLDPTNRAQFLFDTGLRILRAYQLRAIHALQKSAAEGNTRFLFEMATGTGKTLVSAAVIKLFLRTGNASRVLFLVDRIELENQAFKSFNKLLKNDYQTVIYKEKRQEWRKAEIVVSTIQSFMTDNKYLRFFSPTDFDLVISDEAHRSIGGNSRAVFEYFIGYKLGLTATPKNYIKNIDPEKLSQTDPRAWERRQLLDTYQTFGCAQGEPTFRYSLVDGVREGYLVNPIVVDARTEISTQLLSERGYAVTVVDENGSEIEDTFYQQDFERSFFSEETNRQFCRAFLDHALTDPITGEVGKSIIFCVSQNHASKITQILNEMAHNRWPGRYHSDFAVQVTSNIPGAQEFAISFSNNNLNGHSRVVEGYKTSKTRVCVTVAMMTTGYDCTDILNLAMMRPVFSPTDFIQMKGRGTRRHDFQWKNNRDHQGADLSITKENFKLFDFFGNYEYFEEEFNYDEVLELPKTGTYTLSPPAPPTDPPLVYENVNPDPLHKIGEVKIGMDGMKIDRKLFENFSKPILEDKELSNAVAMRQWERAVQLLRDNYANKPEDYVTIDKLMRAEGLDRRPTWKEVLMRIFGLIDRFKTRDELLEEEFQKFVAVNKPAPEKAVPFRTLLTVYLTDLEIRKIIEEGNFSQLADNPKISLADLEKIGKDGIITMTSYIKDYIPLNAFTV